MPGPQRTGNIWLLHHDKSYEHMIIGTNGEKLEHIMRDMKKHTSTQLKEAIKQHSGESRREWMLWMMETAGKKNSQNLNFHCGNRITTQ